MVVEKRLFGTASVIPREPDQKVIQVLSGAAYFVASQALMPDLAFQRGKWHKTRK